MIRKEEVYKIGRITKLHGIKGEVVLNFTDDVFDRVECDYLVLDMDGILVPFFFEEYRFTSSENALFIFEDMDTEQKAKTVVGHDVYFPLSLAEQAEEGELSWSYFVGFKVSDVNHGFIGTITDVENSTVNTLFIIEHEGNEVLMPAQEEFIKDMNQKECTMLVEMPEGMLNLDD